jgi:hypothetical protein
MRVMSCKHGESSTCWSCSLGLWSLGRLISWSYSSRVRICWHPTRLAHVDHHKVDIYISSSREHINQVQIVRHRVTIWIRVNWVIRWKSASEIVRSGLPLLSMARNYFEGKHMYIVAILTRSSNHFWQLLGCLINLTKRAVQNESISKCICWSFVFTAFILFNQEKV